MLFEEEDLFMFMDDRVTPEQWEVANMGLNRQISADVTDQQLWDVLLEEPKESTATQSSLEDVISQPQTTHYEPIKEKKPLSKGSDSNYEKNICAYITKKAVQCFLSSTYRRKVERLCERYDCRYAVAVEYYSKRYKEVFGITHLTLLISPQNEEEIQMKEAFIVFLKWFLRQKYMLYLLKNGKMSEKEKYVEFKNKYLLFVTKTEQKFSNC